MYFALIILYFLIVKARHKWTGKPVQDITFAKLLGINPKLVLVAIIILGISAIVLHWYSKRYKILGEIKIDCDAIIIEQNNIVQTFLMRDISNLLIDRGSTWKYDYRTDNYLVETDNWVKFDVNGRHFEIEFCLTTAEENKDFENMIVMFNQNRINHRYLTI